MKSNMGHDCAHEAGRGIVITGASAGLGAALARAYASSGVVLGLLGRDERQLAAVARQCINLGAIVEIGIVDVRDADKIENWLDHFDRTYGIDLLIANAGVASTLASSDDWEGIKTFNALVDINFFGALHCLLPTLKRMRARRRGQVAIVSSIAAIRGMAISPAYCASKAALKAYGESIRPLLARDGVTLTIVLPGFIKTAMSDAFPGPKPFMWSADKAARIIRKRMIAGRSEIAFPTPLVWGVRLLQMLPAALADAVLARMSYLPKARR